MLINGANRSFRKLNTRSFSSSGDFILKWMDKMPSKKIQQQFDDNATKQIKEKLIITRIPKLNHTQVALAAMDALKYQTSTVGVWDGISIRSIQIASSFSPKEITMILNAFSRMNMYDKRIFKVFKGEIIHRIEDFDIASLASIVSSFSRVNVSDWELFDSICHQITNNSFMRLNPHGLCLFAKVLSKMNPPISSDSPDEIRKLILSHPMSVFIMKTLPQVQDHLLPSDVAALSHYVGRLKLLGSNNNDAESTMDILNVYNLFFKGIEKNLTDFDYNHAASILLALSSTSQYETPKNHVQNRLNIQEYSLILSQKLSNKCLKLLTAESQRIQRKNAHYGYAEALARVLVALAKMKNGLDSSSILFFRVSDLIIETNAIQEMSLKSVNQCLQAMAVCDVRREEIIRFAFDRFSKHINELSADEVRVARKIGKKFAVRDHIFITGNG